MSNITNRQDIRTIGRFRDLAQIRELAFWLVALHKEQENEFILAGFKEYLRRSLSSIAPNLLHEMVLQELRYISEFARLMSWCGSQDNDPAPPRPRPGLGGPKTGDLSGLFEDAPNRQGELRALGAAMATLQLNIGRSPAVLGNIKQHIRRRYNSFVADLLVKEIERRLGERAYVPT